MLPVIFGKVRVWCSEKFGKVRFGNVRMHLLCELPYKSECDSNNSEKFGELFLHFPGPRFDIA